MGTVVLAHKGGNGHAKGTGDHPGQSVGLRVGGPGGHNRGAEGIDTGLNQGIGQVKHHQLQPRRNADGQDSPQELGLNAQPGQLQGVLLLPQQHYQQHSRTDHLGDDCRQRRTGNPHFQANHQHQIHHNIHKAGYDQRDHRPLGVAHSPQNARLHIIKHGGQRSGEINAHIQRGHIQAVRRGVHPLQRHRPQANAQDHDQKAQQQRQSDTRVQGVPDALLVSGSIELGQNDRGPRPQAREKAVEDIYQRPRGSHRRQSLGADEAPNDDGIHRIIHLLEKGPQQDGKEKGQNLFPDDPFRDLFCCRTALHCAASLRFYREF